ncbi:MAG: hypothetical protein K8T91_23635 [Planctomycetes bacterium]|nr:hypothetical protein [Planctomycetota bacterium]
MEWFDACVGSWLVTSRYEKVPALQPFSLYDFHLDPGIRSFNVCGYLLRLPDHPDLPEGQIPDRADLSLFFMDIMDLQLSGLPNRDGGTMQITKLDDASTRFIYESGTFHFSGVCDRAVIGGFGVLAKHDPSHPEPRGPRLFSHCNVWNSCLLLLREFGYSLQVTGHPAHGEFPSRLHWHATTDNGAELSANSPIELLGLASLHRYHQPNIDKPYWWRINGEPLLNDLLAQWQRRSTPSGSDNADPA